MVVARAITHAARAKRLVAITLLYGIVGFAFSSWVTRTPAVRDALGISTARMGVVLLALAAGSMVGLAAAGRCVSRSGSRGVTIIGLATAAAGLALAAVSTSWSSEQALIGALIVYGMGNGFADVGLNVEGSTLERHSGKSVLPVLHAGYSAGNLIGAGVGVAAIGAGVSATVHMAATAALCGAVVFVGRRFIPADADRAASEESPDKEISTLRTSVPIWRDGPFLCIGVVVLGMAFAEGSAHDWLPLVFVDGYDTDKSLAAALYGLFVTAMLVSRILGARMINRFGRVAVLRFTAGFSIVGVALVIAHVNLVMAGIGVAMWGFGSALGFPIGISAAGDDPDRAAVRVSAVTVLGFVAFLAGPPLLGYLSHELGLLIALFSVLVGVVGSLLFASAVRER